MYYILALLSVCVAASALTAHKSKTLHERQLEEVKSLEKREKACEDLANSLLEAVQMASSSSPIIAQQIAYARVGIEQSLQFDPSNKEELTAFICRLEDANNINELGAAIKIPPGSEYYLARKLGEVKQAWNLVGGADGLNRLSEPLLRAVDAYERMGVFNLV